MLHRVASNTSDQIALLTPSQGPSVSVTSEETELTKVGHCVKSEDFY